MGLDGRCLDADATGWPGQVHPAQRVINLRDLAFMSISSGPKMASVIWPTRRMRSQLRTFRSGQHWLLVWNINLLYWSCLTFRSIVIWNREKVLVTCCNAFQTSLRCATICLHCTTLCLNAGTVLTTTLTHKMCLWYFTSAWGKFKPLCLNSLQIAMMIFFSCNDDCSLIIKPKHWTLTWMRMYAILLCMDSIILICCFCVTSSSQLFSFYGFYLDRFYFRNWHGLNDKEPSVLRYAQRTSASEKSGSPLLEMPSLEYLFAQVGVSHSHNSQPDTHWFSCYQSKEAK